MDDDNRLVEALRETLMQIAGVSGMAAKQLRPGQSLIADLGLDDIDLEVLAGCQCRLGDRMRPDRGTTRIDADALRDLTVSEVFALTLRHVLGRELNAPETSDLFVRAQAGLRGPKSLIKPAAG
jgi:hypothetical protein